PRGSARLFDIPDEETLDQLQAMERDVLLPAGRRWFAVVEDGRRVALAALLLLEAAGLMHPVVRFPAAPRRPLPGAPGAGAVPIYDGIGFERVAPLASWVAALDRWGDPEVVPRAP